MFFLLRVLLFSDQLIGLQWKLMDLRGTPKPTVPERKARAWKYDAKYFKTGFSKYH